MCVGLSPVMFCISALSGRLRRIEVVLSIDDGGLKAMSNFLIQQLLL